MLSGDSSSFNTPVVVPSTIVENGPSTSTKQSRLDDYCSTPSTSQRKSPKPSMPRNYIPKTPIARKVTKASVKFYLDEISSSQKDDTDMALGKMIFGCGLPMHITDFVHFKNFCKVMRPAYKVPCRQTVATSLLDRVHKTMVNDGQ